MSRGAHLVRSAWEVWLPLAFAAAALVFAGSQIAAGQSSGPGAYRACATGSAGVLRLVEAGQECAAGERAESWSAVGAPGPRGPGGGGGAQGPVGPAGPAGPRGFTGYDYPRMYLVTRGAHAQNGHTISGGHGGPEFASGVAPCLKGDRVFAGGVYASPPPAYRVATSRRARAHNGLRSSYPVALTDAQRRGLQTNFSTDPFLARGATSTLRYDFGLDGWRAVARVDGGDSNFNLIEIYAWCISR